MRGPRTGPEWGVLYVACIVGSIVLFSIEAGSFNEGFGTGLFMGLFLVAFIAVAIFLYRRGNATA